MEGAGVRIADNAGGMDCKPISNIEAEAGSKEKAEILLRNKAGEMNANTVWVTDTLENGGQVRLKGKAIGCKTPAAGQAPDAQQ